jgi:hypothetical protein
MNLKTNFNFAFLPMTIDIISSWTWCVAIGRNTKAFEASAILAITIVLACLGIGS